MMKFAVYQNDEIKGTYQENPDSENKLGVPKAPKRGSKTRIKEVSRKTGRPTRRDACQEPRSHQREKLEHYNVGDSTDDEATDEDEFNERKMTTQVPLKAFQRRSQENAESECDGPAGHELAGKAIGFHQDGKVECDGPAGPKFHEDGTTMDCPIGYP